MALVLHVLVAAFLVWAPTHHHDEPDDPIEVTMEAPPPPEPKPEIETQKPKPPPAAASKPAPALDRLGLPPAGPVGPKSTAPPMERGLPTYEPPSQKAEQPTPKDEPAQKQEPPQQAMAQPAEPPPPPPPTLEKELPPVEAPPAPLTSRDVPRLSPPVPERKPEPPQQQRPQQQQPRPQSSPSPQIQPSPLSRLPRNAPSQRQTEQPRSTFVNPADTYAQNTVMEAYLQRVVYQVSRYTFDGAGLSPSDSVVARFTIARNGSLLAISIIRSSGKPSLDRDAVTAFQRTAPFPPLPAEAQGDSMTFSLTFFPGRRP
jgi:protein TonB